MSDEAQQKLTRKQLEAELASLRAREALFEACEAFAHVGHFEFNVTRRRFESCSQAFARLFDLSREQVLAPRAGMKKLLRRIHPEDRACYQALLDGAEDPLSLEFEYRIIHGDDRIRHFYQTGVERPHDDGGDVILAGIVQDVTAQGEPESDYEYRESLALQAERIAEIGNFIYDEVEDRYIYASPGCARIYGVSQEEYLRSIESVEDDLSDVYEADRERLHQAYIQYFNSGEDCRLEFRAYRADGELRWIRELLVALEMKDGKVALSRGVLQDITEHKRIEMELRAAKLNLEQLVAERTSDLASTVEQLEHEIKEREKISSELEFLANHDPLTGLPSLRLCKDRLERALAEARRGESLAAVLFVDLDGFKAINDNYGHERGNDVLKTTAGRIRGEVRETDTVARIGGDEFLVILSGLPDLSVAQRIAGNLVRQVSQAIRIDDDDVHIGASIGIAVYPDDATDSDGLIRMADQAMYGVKQTGKNDFGFHKPDRLN